MKDKSTLGPWEYVIEGIVWSLISMIWYKNLLFRCLEGYTFNQSRVILFGMLAASIILCRFWVFRVCRNYWTLIVALLLPYGIYTILAYNDTLKYLTSCVLLIAGIISCLFSLLILTRRVKNTAKKTKIVRRRAYRCFWHAVSVFALGMAVIMMPMILHGAFGTTIFKSSVRATSENNYQDQTISNNIEMIMKLQENKWEKLSTQEKLDVMQTVANIEARYLGLSNELNVGATNLAEYTLAAYSDPTHTIYISLNHLENDSAYEVLNSCCHEAYHAYQHRLIDAYNSAEEELKNLRIYKKAVLYIREFNDYADGYENFCAYYYQECESDAREYAEIAVKDYLFRISEYCEDNNGDFQANQTTVD